MARHATRVAVLDDGAIVLDGTPADVFAHVDRLRVIGIGMPQLAELAEQLSHATGKRYRFLRMADAYDQLRHDWVDGAWSRKTRRDVGMREFDQVNPLLPPSPAVLPTGDPSILIEHVSFNYPDGIPALRDGA